MALKIRADLGQLNRIREYVTERATELGIPSAVFDDLRLAVDEAVTNVLVHGYGGAGDLEIELRGHGPDLHIFLRDRAPPFDPVGNAPRDLVPPGDRESPGGFGIFLMQSAMDEILHRETRDGNELTLVKRGVLSTPASSHTPSSSGNHGH